MLEISYCRLKSLFFFACGAHRFKTMFKDDIHPKNPPVIADNYVDVLVVCLAPQVNNRLCFCTSFSFDKNNLGLHVYFFI